MLIWRGWGWMVPVLFVAIYAGGQLLTDAITGDGTYWLEQSWVKFAACFVASSVVGFLGYVLNVGGYQLHISEGLPKESFYSHTFMFVPMQYWGVLLLAFGAYAIFFMVP